MELRRFKRRGRVHRSVFVLSLLAGLAGGGDVSRVAAQDAATAISHGWPAALGPALEAYFQEDYERVQQYCGQIIASERDGDLRREAATLQSLALLRSPSRNDRLHGRARLGQLQSEEPALQNRPECLLAYGVGQSALNETGSALDNLDRAAQLFARRGQNERAGAALCRLAEAWLKHGEWESTPPRFRVPTPESPAHVRAIRRTRLELIRARISGLPESVEALSRFDLIDARDLLASGEAPERGVALLEKLAGAESFSSTTAQAAMDLAELRGRESRWPEALALYRRVAGARLGETSERAGRRASEITRPQIELSVDAVVRPGAAASIGLRVRNLSAARLEVRRVDLEAWLRKSRGALVEARLPVTGSVRMARDFDTEISTPLDWWSCESLGEPLTFEAGAGAYVVFAHAQGPEGERILSKKLVLVSDLAAMVFTGARDAVVWASHREGSPMADEPVAFFWMHGLSFVATKPKLRDGAARFALPPESRLAREKRWTCLVRAGDHLALCRGRLGGGESSGAGPSPVALVAGPLQPRAGETLRVAGMLLPGGGDADSEAAAAPLELVLLDALDETRGVREVSVSAGGTFAGEFVIGAEWGGKQLRVIARRGGRVLENVRGRLGVSVPRADGAGLRINLETQPLVLPTEFEVRAVVRASYPWGVPLSDASMSYIARGLHLPTPDSEFEPADAARVMMPIANFGRLDESGRFDLRLSRAEYELPPGPVAMGFWFEIQSWDGRSARVDAVTLLGTESIHTWLEADPADPVRGRPVRFRLGWFDPVSQTGGAPELEVLRDGRVVARLSAYPTVEGLESDVWTPVEAGRYQVVATLRGAEPVTIRRDLLVGEDAAPLALRGSAVRCVARFGEREGQPVVLARLDGRSDGPLLVFAEDGEPLGARSVSRLAGSVEVVIPVRAIRSGQTRVWVVAMSAEGPKRLTTEVASSAPGRSVAVNLRVGSPAVRPGMIANVDVVCSSADGSPRDAFILARLVDAFGYGHVHWLPGPVREAGGGAKSIGVASSIGGGDWELPGEEDGAESETLLPRALKAALYEGANLWVGTAATENGRVGLRVPIPPDAGRYRLIVAARTSDGAFAMDSVVLDAAGGVRLQVDVAPNFTVGDRSVAAVSLENTLGRPVSVRVRFDAKKSLVVESVRRLQPPQRLKPAAGENVYELTLAAKERATLLAEVEAAAGGEDEFRVELECEGIRQSAAGTYRVRELAPRRNRDSRAGSEKPGGSIGPIAICRTVLALTPETGRFTPYLLRESEEGFVPQELLRTVLEAGDQLSAGQLLLIRDEFELEQALPSVEWTQRLPATCRTLTFDPIELRRLGEPRGGRLDSLSYTIAGLQAGSQTHEFCVVAIRPGSCVLPPPIVRVSGEEIAVEIRGNVERISVSDSP